MMTYLHDHKILLLDKNFSVSILEFLATTGYYPGPALLMQIHFRLPWIGDQLHQPTTRTHSTKIGASRYKVRADQGPLSPY